MALMEKLVDLPELDAASIELLEAVGIDRVTALAKSSCEHLQTELTKANSMLRIRKDDPDALEITRWINAARDQAGERAESLSFVKPVQASNSAPLELSVLDAIAVPPKRLMDGGVSVSDVPVMDVFFTEEELVNTVREETGAATEIPANASPNVVRMRGGDGIPFDSSQQQQTEEKAAPKKKIEPLKSKGPQLATAPLPETNAGKKEHSRGYIRGVLHPQPFKVYLGAFIAIITLTLLPLSFVALVMIMLKQSLWWAAVPATAIVFALLYLMFSTGPRCRICGQPLFIPKRCRRHVKAHHIALMGYIVPTSLQLLLFKWFRCIFCGTSVRLKE